MNSFLDFPVLFLVDLFIPPNHFRKFIIFTGVIFPTENNLPSLTAVKSSFGWTGFVEENLAILDKITSFSLRQLKDDFTSHLGSMNS